MGIISDFFYKIFKKNKQPQMLEKGKTQQPKKVTLTFDEELNGLIDRKKGLEEQQSELLGSIRLMEKNGDHFEAEKLKKEVGNLACIIYDLDYEIREKQKKDPFILETQKELSEDVKKIMNGNFVPKHEISTPDSPQDNNNEVSEIEEETK